MKIPTQASSVVVSPSLVSSSFAAWLSGVHYCEVLAIEESDVSYEPVLTLCGEEVPWWRVSPEESRVTCCACKERLLDLAIREMAREAGAAAYLLGDG